MNRIKQLREIESRYSRGQMLTFLKSLAGAASAAIKDEKSWDICITAGHLAVNKFGEDNG